MRIFLSRGDLANAVQVHPQRGLVARSGGEVVGPHEGEAARPAVAGHPEGRRRTVLQFQRRGWHQLRSVAGTLEFAAKGRPLTLDTQTGPVRYRGLVRSVPSSPGNRLAVNVVPMESYLRGVVPAEVVASNWPQQAQRAQAVAARSYAALKRSERRAKVYDLDDTASYQHYLGVDAEWPTSDRAVAATAGEIRTYGGEPAFTEFTASNGGWTVGRRRAVPGRAARTRGTRTPWGPVDVQRRRARGRLATGRRPAEHRADRSQRAGEWGGRVGSVTLTGTGGSVRTSGDAFYQRLGLQSAWLSIDVH